MSGNPLEELLKIADRLDNAAGMLSVWSAPTASVFRGTAEVIRENVKRINPTVGGKFWTPEDVARRFHEHYERMAPAFSYETRKDSAVAWEDVPHKNKALMLAVAACVMDDLGMPVKP